LFGGGVGASLPSILMNFSRMLLSFCAQTKGTGKTSFPHTHEEKLSIRENRRSPKSAETRKCFQNSNLLFWDFRGVFVRCGFLRRDGGSGARRRQQLRMVCGILEQHVHSQKSLLECLCKIPALEFFAVLLGGGEMAGVQGSEDVEGVWGRGKRTKFGGNKPRAHGESGARNIGRPLCHSGHQKLQTGPRSRRECRQLCHKKH